MAEALEYLMGQKELPIPDHYDDSRTEKVWQVPYQERAAQAEAWAREWEISPARADRYRVCLLVVDVQNTFCLPEFELFVGGRSGRAAVEDNCRLCRFIYRNLNRLTRICPTLDSHQAIQIFHPAFLVNREGKHPRPFELISPEEIRRGRWKVNPNVLGELEMDEEHAADYLAHYAEQLRVGGKYDWTVWPYHAMVGGIGHALVSAVEEAIFFHSLARHTNPVFQIKGLNPMTEHYSVLGPEITRRPDGHPVGRKNERLVRMLAEFDAVLVAGQAKSHCVAWTVSDLLENPLVQQTRMAERLYILEDCTSPVVIPGVVDYTDAADALFRKFTKAGVRLVRSSQPMSEWFSTPD